MYLSFVWSASVSVDKSCVQLQLCDKPFSRFEFLAVLSKVALL